MGFHVEWNGPQIWIEIVVALIVAAIIWRIAQR